MCVLPTYGFQSHIGGQALQTGNDVEKHVHHLHSIGMIGYPCGCDVYGFNGFFFGGFYNLPGFGAEVHLLGQVVIELSPYGLQQFALQLAAAHAGFVGAQYQILQCNPLHQ